MNALLRKELRMLLPAWVAALLAATLPLWTGRNYQGAAMPCFGLAVLFLGLTPFGQEMSCGTFRPPLEPAGKARAFLEDQGRAARFGDAVCLGRVSLVRVVEAPILL